MNDIASVTAEDRYPSDADVDQLMEFYQTTTTKGLIGAMLHHIERLQAKLPQTLVSAVNRQREG